MHLGKWLEEKYGPDSVAMLVDEGSNMEHLWGQLYATPAVAEKGMLDAEIRVETKGGHSSVPRAYHFYSLPVDLPVADGWSS